MTTSNFKAVSGQDYFLSSVEIDADSVIYIAELGKFLIGFSNQKKKIYEKKLNSLKTPIKQVAVGYTDCYQYKGLLCSINSTYSIFKI